jgi:hypothetical protein
VVPRSPGAVVEKRRELAVHLVEIADGVLVEDDHVGAEPLEPPVLLGPQDLAHQRKVVLLDDPDVEEGKVARDAVRPEPFLTELAPGQDLRARGQ